MLPRRFCKEYALPACIIPSLPVAQSVLTSLM